MKRNLTIVLFLIICKFSIGQDNDYSNYYKHKYLAEAAIFENKYEDAFIEYEIAFENVNYIFTKDLVNSAILSVILNYDSVFKDRILTAFCHGWEVKHFIKKDTLYNYKISLSQELVSKYDSCRKVYFESFNIELLEELRLMEKRDQEHRRPFLFGIIPKLSHPNWKRKKMHVDDSLNMSDLTAIIGRYGFPSEEIIGYTNNSPVDIILHHASEKYIGDSVLVGFVLTGCYSPYSFARRYDYHYTNYTYDIDEDNRLLTKAYYIYTYSSIRSDALKDKVNSYRAEILLPTIEHEIKKSVYRKNNKYQFYL